ncbi:MAG: glycosyltransferase, partial [Rhodospirillaceae bacterium]|nr:glycosyltransferase [Rhodospirillaceae bacterium]
MLSIIIPTLNAATSLEATLSALEAPGIETQVIISDGGSSDGTQGIATQRGALLIEAPTGRGAQLAEGAKAATRPWLLFLHADTR